MNRSVLITGAATGLGLSLAEHFIREGDCVYGVSRTKSHWKEARSRIPERDRFILYQADVSSEPKVKHLISQVFKQAGRIDVLINNAGYANRFVRTEKENIREFEKHFSQNLLSVFLMCKYALPIFQRQNFGWIMNIASMAGKRAVPGMGAYSASKSGVIALGQCIAKENPDAGFKCVTVCPGGINTEMRVKIFGKEDANRQQHPDFVADKIMEILERKIEVPSGGDIIIRHSQVTAINAAPPA